MAFSFRKALGATSALGLVITLAACGPDELAVRDAGHFALGDVSGPYDWPMVGEYGAPGSISSDAFGDWSPLGAARPMVARAPGRYDYAPAWDYPDDYRYEAPEFASYGDWYRADGYEGTGHYEEGYYDSSNFERAYYGPTGHDWYDRSVDSSSYALLALAAVLGSVIGTSPPDYYFDYGGVRPWVWITGDRYVRYAEPLPAGYRYYYYAPDAARPFLVRDPLYTYGYSDDRLVVIYDSYGRVLNRDRALPLRRAATSYYDRGVTLYQTGLTSERYGVPAPLWQQRSATVVADQQVWDRARNWNPGWRDVGRRYEEQVGKKWERERIARTYAAKRFASWQDEGYRSPAPQPGRELRAKSNPNKALLQQAALESRRYEDGRRANGKGDRPERLSGAPARQLRQAGAAGSGANSASLRTGQSEARPQRAERMAPQQRDRSKAQVHGAGREQAVRTQRSEVRRVAGERKEATKAQGQQRAERQRQSVRQQTEARGQSVITRMQEAQRQQELHAKRQQRVQAQSQQQDAARQRQAQTQRQQQAQSQRQQQAQAQRQQREAARQQQPQAQRQQQAQAQRQQQMAGQQQAQAQRQQQMARQQQAQAERQQQMARQQQAQVQRQQQVQPQQRAQRQQQAFAQRPERGQGGEDRGNGRGNN
jgi:hypothetical protein